MPRPIKYQDQQIINAYNGASNWKEFYYGLGISKPNYNSKRLKARVKELGLDTSHFIGKSYFTEEEFLVKAKRAVSKGDLARRLGIVGYETTKIDYLIKKHKIKFRRKLFVLN